MTVIRCHRLPLYSQRVIRKILKQGIRRGSMTCKMIGREVENTRREGKHKRKKKATAQDRCIGKLQNWVVFLGGLACKAK